MSWFTFQKHMNTVLWVVLLGLQYGETDINNMNHHSDRQKVAEKVKSLTLLQEFDLNS